MRNARLVPYRQHGIKDAGAGIENRPDVLRSGTEVRKLGVPSFLKIATEAQRDEDGNVASCGRHRSRAGEQGRKGLLKGGAIHTVADRREEQSRGVGIRRGTTRQGPEVSTTSVRRNVGHTRFCQTVPAGSPVGDRRATGRRDTATWENRSMAHIKTFAELTTPDERTLRFTPLGFSTMETISPKAAAEFQQQVIAHCDLHPDVAEGTRNGFERLRTLHSYGVLCYDTFTVVDDLAWLLLEQALRERFLEFHGGVVPLRHATTGEERPLAADTFDVVDDAFRRGGSHGRGRWVLPLSDGSRMGFRGGMAQLQEWARKERLLDGQRNKRLDPVHVAMRNAVAHPHYHLAMPPDSARTIRDLAEMINRLWGHRTPGGRLYPEALDRQILIVAWTDAERGVTHTLLRDYQLADFVRNPAATAEGPWTCIVVRGVFEDESIMEFNAQYEYANYPVDFLWGSGTLEDARAWITSEQPQVDTANYLDRLFAVRIHEGRASLARRPEVALALPEERRSGRWLIVRADFPNDAFGHARHLKDGIPCGGAEAIVRHLQGGITTETPPLPHCAVEDLFDGDWDGMAKALATTFHITEPASLLDVRVRQRFSMGVAPDVEAD